MRTRMTTLRSTRVKIDYYGLKELKEKLERARVELVRLESALEVLTYGEAGQRTTLTIALAEAKALYRQYHARLIYQHVEYNNS